MAAVARLPRLARLAAIFQARRPTSAGYRRPTPHRFCFPLSCDTRKSLAQALLSWGLVNVTMLSSCLLLALVVGGSHAGSEPECGEGEEQELQSRVSSCLASVTFQFEDARDAAREVVEVQEAACQLVARAVDDCGSMWEECHSGEEVKINPWSQ